MTAESPNRTFLLTPAGTGAIGVIRVLGPGAPEVLNRAFRPRDSSRCVTLEGDRLFYGVFVEGDETIDDVIIGPSRDDGSRGFDIHAHGGVRVTERILQALADHGAPLVQDAEDSPSLWPSAGHLADEAVRAARHARTERAVLFVARMRTLLPNALTRVAAVAREHPDDARSALWRMLDRSRAARVLVEGAAVALIGPPNSGKSTLYNRLVGRSAVVVSPGPGTTRDWVSAPISVEGVPLTLFDTAGIRTPSDALEDQAIRAGRSIVSEAGAKLLVVDGSDPHGIEKVDDDGTIAKDRRVIIAVNKLDQGCAIDSAKLLGLTRFVPVCKVSAEIGTGVDRLIAMLLRFFGFDGWSDSAPSFFSQHQMDPAKAALSALDDGDMVAFAEIMNGLIGL